MDATEILGVGWKAGPEEIREAYLRKVKEHPPDRDPEEFEKIRDAYEILSDPRRRMRDLLLSADAHAPLMSLFAARGPLRRFASPQPWQEVLKGK